MISVIQFLNIKRKLRANNKTPHSFTGKDKRECHFKWITDCSTSEVLRVRNASHVRKMCSNQDMISGAEHEHFLASYNNFPRIDFIIVDGSDESSVGAIQISLSKWGLEIGKYIGDTNYLGRGIAKAAMISALKFFQLEFQGNDIFAVTRKVNQANIGLNQKLGFEILKEINREYYLMRLEVV